MSVSSLIPRLAIRPAALGLSLLAVAGGHAAYDATAKTVAVTVDGHQQTVRSHAGSVRDVLSAAHLSVSSHDLLAPALGTRVQDGSTIVLRRGRQMLLTIDGAQRTVWVTATSVDEALDQIGLRGTGAVLSADRSRAIPLKGFSLDVRTRKQVQLLDAGRVRQVATNSLRVKDLLAELRVKVRPRDRLSVLYAAPVKDGMVVRITRIDGRRAGEDVAIPFGVERRADGSMFQGQSRVLRAGRVGVMHRTYALGYVNGRLTSKRLAGHSVRTAAPISKVILVGTKVRPRPVSTARTVSGTGGLNWGALANCESGGNPRAVSSGGTYRGLYQFSLSTWHGVGGSGDPIDASSSEQTYRAQVLYSRSGRSSWPVCGQYL